MIVAFLYKWTKEGVKRDEIIWEEEMDNILVR